MFSNTDIGMIGINGQMFFLKDYEWFVAGIFIILISKDRH